MRDLEGAPTKQEARWFARLRRVLKEMPTTCEITVHAHGNISLHERGATKEEFQRNGDSDNTPDLDSFQAKNVRGEESSI